MRVGINSFQAERLAQARDSRGLTQVALSQLIDKASASISRWESGRQLPEPQALDELSRALNVPVAFFLKPNAEHGSAPLFYRSMASVTKALRTRAGVRLRWAQEISYSLQEYVDLPAVALPHLKVTDLNKITNDDIERAAGDCRRIWELGTAPIADLLLVLENAGIVVIKEEISATNMDGVSNWSAVDKRPYVFIAKDKDTCARSRLDAAHELGHLVLHRYIDKSALFKAEDFKEIERQAFYFAGAFLMPAESFGSEIWNPSINSLLALKARWKVSVGAMIMRCSALGIITEDYQRQLWKYYSARGWRKNEPLDNELVPESPRLLSRSIKLLLENGIKSREQLLNDFCLSGHDVESLTDLPRGYMSDQKAEVVALPKLKGKGGKAEENQGNTVVPFKPR